MKKVLCLILALVMVLSLVACGATTEETTQQPESETATTTTPDTAEQQSAPGDMQQSMEGDGTVVEYSDRVLNMPNTVLLGNVDPTFVTGMDGQYILFQVFEGLIKYDEKTGESYPRVAESWEFAPDNSYIEFKINPEATFHNGDPVTADDVIYSYDRYNAQAGWASKLVCFTGWEAIDESTVRFNLSGTSPTPLLYMTEIMILHKDSIEAAGDTAFTTPETAIGTGPFYFTEIDFDGDIVAMAYENYFRGRANIGGVKWTYLTDASTALAAFQTGDFDFAKLPTANVLEMEALGMYNVLRIPSTHNSFIGINYGKISDPLVRQAILYALDNEAIMNVAYDGLGIVSNNMAESDMIAGGYSFDDYYDYNPEMAKELLLQAGYTEAELEEGVFIGNIVAMSTNYYAKVATIVQEMLKQVGLVTEVTTYEQATVEDLWFYRGEGSEDMALVCHGDNIKIDASLFFTHYINRRSKDMEEKWEQWGLEGELQDVGKAAISEFDTDTRNELWVDFWTMLKDQAIYYSLFHRDNTYIASPDLNVAWGVNYYHIYDWSWNK